MSSSNADPKVCSKADSKADLILNRGSIYAVDGRRSWAEAVAIGEGRVIAIGTDLDIDAFRGPQTRTVDLRGRMVMPGIIDVHNHHTRGGQADLFETTILPTLSFEEVIAVVRARAATTKPGDWISGGIWGSNIVGRLYSRSARAALDAASPDHPVMLRDDSQHSRWVNSRALAIMGVDADTPNPLNGEIVRDPDTGEATGLLLERASTLAETALARTVEDAAGRNVSSTRRAVQILNSFGVTAYQDANTMLPYLQALAELDGRGQLTAWCVASMPAHQPLMGTDIFGDALIALRESFRSRHVRPDFVKIFMDGVPTTRTASMREPYTPDKLHGCCFRGEALVSIPELARWIAKCEKLGLSTKIHCAGDGAVRDTLDAIDVVRSFNGPGRMHQIAHAGFIDPDDVARFKELDVVADLSPIIWYPSPIIEAIKAAVPEARAARYWPNRDLLAAGALMAAGSDWPVVSNPDPWLGIEGMVTRQNPRGGFPGALWPEQALDLADVLEIYTRNPARAIGLDTVTGSLEPGKSADLIVLDRNLFEIPSDDLAETRVLATYFEGELVFERD
ncbi:MAG: amidohydrolase [Xanthobacteraceae bacterium]|nr:amidohydrolase [Xanthobacteraceae bacterium]